MVHRPSTPPRHPTSGWAFLPLACKFPERREREEMELFSVSVHYLLSVTFPNHAEQCAIHPTEEISLLFKIFPHVLHNKMFWYDKFQGAALLPPFRYCDIPTNQAHLLHTSTYSVHVYSTYTCSKRSFFAHHSRGGRDYCQIFALCKMRVCLSFATRSMSFHRHI